MLFRSAALSRLLGVHLETEVDELACLVDTPWFEERNKIRVVGPNRYSGTTDTNHE